MVATLEEMDLGLMRAAANEASRLLKTLGSPARLMLLCQLSQRECCVGELEERLGILQPTLSQQLGVLREEGLVRTRRDGKQIFYAIASSEAMAVMKVLYEQFCERSGNDG